MKKFSVICLSMMLLACVSVMADGEKTTNLVVGFTPGIGQSRLSIKHDAKNGAKDKFTYNQEVAVNVGLERVLNGIIILPELHYSRSKLNKDEIAPNSQFPYGELKNLSEVGFMQYFGFTLNAKKRFQVPLMAGVGIDYMFGEPVHNCFWAYGVKARMKFYITPKVGIFAGGMFKGNYGTSNRGEDSGYHSDDAKFKLNKTNFNAEVGLTITLH